MSSHIFCPLTNHTPRIVVAPECLKSFSVIIRKPLSDVVAQCHHLIFFPLTNHKPRIVVAPECLQSFSVFNQKPRSDVVGERLHTFFATTNQAEFLHICSLRMSSHMFFH